MNLQFWKTKPTPNFGAILLGIWLVATGLLQLFPGLHVRYSSTVVPLLAVGSGLAILLDVQTSTLFLTLALLAIIVGLVMLR